ncbi:heterokaryon incompatibility protein-domain-containing protein, partial [Leptodontidium sp. 2 PMI_412]
MVATSNRPIPCIQAFLVADEYNSASPLKARLPPRCVVDVSLIRHWLRFCETNHKETCGTPPWFSPSATLPEHFRVIDVQNSSVVVAPENCRYCALSYVWGQNKIFQTTRDNIGEVAKPGGLLNVPVPLSQCVLDAINLVKAMGERYLWVDALCILQGDADDLKSQIGHMDIIYTKAIVTFVSAEGSSSKVGLPGVWPHLRALPQVTEEVEEGLRLALLLEPGRSLPESVWNSRAWT